MHLALAPALLSQQVAGSERNPTLTFLGQGLKAVGVALCLFQQGLRQSDAFPVGMIAPRGNLAPFWVDPFSRSGQVEAYTGPAEAGGVVDVHAAPVLVGRLFDQSQT